MVKKFIIFLFLCLGFNCVYAAESNPYNGQFIDVGTPNAKKIRIAVANFSIVQSDSHVPMSATTTRFKELLEFTNWFYLIPENVFKDVSSPIAPFKQSVWKTLQADFVVFGTITPKNKDDFEINLWATNVASGKIIVQKKYFSAGSLEALKKLNSSGQVTERMNLVLRDFGDLFVKAITGTPSPFMSRIAFVGRKALKAQTADIYIADFDGSNPIKITNNNSINISPAWAPDGSKITYTSFITGKAEIFEYTINSNKTRQITYENANSSGSAWNNTGDLIAFSSSTKEGSTYIYTTTGGPHAAKESLVTSGTIAVEPAFSPNGTYLAYTSNKYAKPMIFLFNFENNVTTRLTFSGWYNASAAWAPDSTQLSYASFDKETDRWDLFRIDVDGSDLIRLTLKQGDNERPTWSPDGRFIMFQSNRGTGDKENTISGNTYKLYVMDPDGDNQRMIKTSIPDCRQPAWGPRLKSIE